MPKVVDHDARRALILDRCFELFARHGYGSVRMRQIARETGLSIGSIYHYFPDKEAIGEQLFQHAAMRFAVEAEGRIQPGMSRPERLQAVWEFIEPRQETLTQLLLLGLDHHRLYPQGRSATVGAMRSFKALLRQLVALEPEEVDALYSLLCGAMIRAVLDPEDMRLEDQLAGF